MSARVKVDSTKYGQLLSQVHPTVIKTEEEHQRLLAEIERLIDKGDKKSPEELALLELLCQLVEAHEAQHHAIEKAEPHEVLQHLMDERGLRQSDLLPIFGSRGYVSDIVNGKRGISKQHAKALAKLFHVSPEVFI
jgi:HTH-type transcriptional regulator/antitoxin HigA